MTPRRRRANPYIHRMAEDMQIRNLADSTIDTYTWHIDKFCSYFGKMPEELGLEEIRQYQLYLVNEKKASWSSFNQAVCALRFLYEVTLGKPGSSSTSPSANDRKNCLWCSPTRKHLSYSNAPRISNTERFCSRSTPRGYGWPKRLT